MADHARQRLTTLLADDGVAGLLARIAAIARLLGAVSRETPVVEIQPALWAIEDLAHDARGRLRGIVEGIAADRDGS